MIEHDGSAKGIVFSQFTSFLDLIQFSLEKVCVDNLHQSKPLRSFPSTVENNLR
jgi:hypothetical protein